MKYMMYKNIYSYICKYLKINFYNFYYLENFVRYFYSLAYRTICFKAYEVYNGILLYTSIDFFELNKK